MKQMDLCYNWIGMHYYCNIVVYTGLLEGSCGVLVHVHVFDTGDSRWLMVITNFGNFYRHR